MDKLSPAALRLLRVIWKATAQVSKEEIDKLVDDLEKEGIFETGLEDEGVFKTEVTSFSDLKVGDLFVCDQIPGIYMKLEDLGTEYLAVGIKDDPGFVKHFYSSGFLVKKIIACSITLHAR